ncbi:hypothetical protein [Amphritea sp. HPY]|uniref:hypothetical protein n=1 Tax=Amphritea sp. HPY TaxID=3421652 RepID=UPI003D7E6F62
MPEQTIDITVKVERPDFSRPRFHNPCVIMRGEMRFNGQALFYEHRVDEYEARHHLDIKPDGTIYVNDDNWFDYMVRRIRSGLMQHIEESYRPRIALGG